MITVIAENDMGFCMVDKDFDNMEDALAYVQAECESDWFVDYIVKNAEDNQ